MTIVSVAVDLMGGDEGVAVTLPGALDALTTLLVRESNGSRRPLLKLVGHCDQTKPIFEDLLKNDRRYRSLAKEIRNHTEFVHAEETIRMDDNPRVAIRSKKNSSMRIALDLVKAGEAHAVISAGNTGALVGMSRFVLKTFPGISRPAIISKIPSDNHPSGKPYCYMLDLGGNVDCSAEHLNWFAEMGAILCSELDQIEAPRVGLLNIGEEDIKGNEQVKAANELLSASDSLNYVGYVEANTIYFGAADVVVCDGFVGNVALKASEGVARYIRSVAKDELDRSPLRKLMGLAALPLFRVMKKRIDPSLYNGAILVGLRGNVIKSHGGTNDFGFTQAVLLAIQSAEKNIAQLIGKRLGHDV